ncbi:MAG: dienelactone hydrolase family protein [Candidatus Binatia bacterium]
MPEPHTGEVVFPSGADSIRAHLAVPSGGIDGPAIVLIPDVHGLSDLYRGLAGRFADRGIAALAIDLYSREGSPKLKDLSDVNRWIASLPDPRVLADLQAAVDWLGAQSRAGRNPVGITGFCMGGQYALLGACTLHGLSACVSFYGMIRYHETNERKPKSPLDSAADLTCPYLGIFGEDDALIPPSDAAALRERLEKSGKAFEIRSYAGCGHAFLNHNRPDAYRPQAAEDAFGRAVEYFLRHLVRGTR